MEISSGDITTALEVVRDRLYGVLDDRSSPVIERARGMVTNSARELRSQRSATRESGIKWGFTIDHDQPLRFKEADFRGHRLKADVFLTSYWDSDPAEEPSILNTVLRVWSLDPSLYFRHDWDAAGIGDRIQQDTGRVMWRAHFDLANLDQSGPKYHMQFGGRQHDEEMHWFPSTLSIPRIAHSPLDLVLATEFVTATFFPEEYKKLRRESTWKGALRKSQRHLMRDHLHKAVSAIDAGASALESWWNVSFC